MLFSLVLSEVEFIFWPNLSTCMLYPITSFNTLGVPWVYLGPSFHKDFKMMFSWLLPPGLSSHCSLLLIYFSPHCSICTSEPKASFSSSLFLRPTDLVTVSHTWHFSLDTMTCALSPGLPWVSLLHLSMKASLPPLILILLVGLLSFLCCDFLALSPPL